MILIRLLLVSGKIEGMEVYQKVYLREEKIEFQKFFFIEMIL